MPIQKYLDPKNDIAFRRLFGTEKNKGILIHFLNDVLARASRIESVEFLPTIYLPEVHEQRISIVDVMCQDQNGNKFIIEMQVVSTLEYLKRAQYYASRAYIGQRVKKLEYKDLKEVVFLAICNKTILPEHNHYISYHVMLEQTTHKNYLKDFSYTFIELDKFDKSADELSSILDKWIYFFKHAEEGEHFPSHLMQEVTIHEALDEMKSFNWTEEELLAYEKIEDEHYAYVNNMEIAKAEARAEGMEKGMEKGRMEEKLEVARNLKKLGLDDARIIVATGLTDAQLKAL